MTKLRLFFFLFLGMSISLGAQLPPAKGTRGMVVTPQYLATQVGIDILKKGGNAIDAAVAVGYALAVVDPCCGNLGGGGFLLYRRNDGRNFFINFREKAPSKTPLKKNTTAGYLSAGIPGTVMGLNTALEKYGTLSLKSVLSPAIRLAEKGFILNEADLNILNYKIDKLQKEPNVSAIFLKKTRGYQNGERLVQRQLAKTLKIIAKGGTSAFYQGPIARKIVDASHKKGGVFTLDDFKNYTISMTMPIRCDYRDYTLLTAPPPASGTTVCEILNVMSAYPLNTWGFHSAEATHYNLEAMRYAFDDRNQYLGDPDFTNNPVDNLISTKHAEEVRSKIVPDKSGTVLVERSANERPETSHYIVVDKNGNAVSVTYTLNGFFGAGVIAEDTGFFLNNTLNDFTSDDLLSLKQGEHNLIAPFKRPLSAMSPTIVLKNDQLFLILGAAGGLTIINTVVETIENVIDFGMDINTALNAPRYHFQSSPDLVYQEDGAFSADTWEKLSRMGYKAADKNNDYQARTGFFGKGMVVERDPKSGIYYGASDNRYPASSASGLN